jgi:hypothetical protein
MQTHRYVLFSLIGVLASVASAQPLKPADVEFFEKQIRPVLSQHCYKCHSASAEKLKGGLLLDTRDGVLKGGEDGPVVVVGKPDESVLIKAISYSDDKLKMPPKTRLPDMVIADLTKWVKMGVPDPRDGAAPAVAALKSPMDVSTRRNYWAFLPLSHVEPPNVQNTQWVRTPIDRFILAKQEAVHLTPNDTASKEKLIRRVYFDLLGLPPTPKDIADFLDDQSPDAYEKLVDRLLASDHYGERWGRHWLDIVRFAESGGYEFDRDRGGAYHYRDFVIRAFNRDMPFDQFVRLQLAGDKLMPGDYDAGCATGFLVAGPYPGQITAKTAEPIRYDQLDDMVSTMGASMLGMTVGCARCHDHKYDAIPTRDYYRLAACLAKTDFTELKLDPKPEIYRKAKAEYDKAHAPLMATWEKFKKDQVPALLTRWIDEELPSASESTWYVLERTEGPVVVPVLRRGNGNGMQSGFVTEASRAPNNLVFIGETNVQGITAIRVEYVPAGKAAPVKLDPADAAVAAMLKAEKKTAPGRAALPNLDVTITALSPGAKPTPVKFRINAKLSKAPAPAQKDGAGEVPGMLVLETETGVGLPDGAILTVSLKAAKKQTFALRGVAISTITRPVDPTVDSAPQAAREIAALLDHADGKITAKNNERIIRWFREVDPQTIAAYRPVAQHAKLEPKPDFATVFAAGNKGNDVYYLNRGDVGKKAGIATPGFLEVLMYGSTDDESWTGEPTTAKNKPAIEPRVALANWMTDTDHGAGQLLARVIVNRLWQHHLGRGIVSTPNDFGTQGDRPTHPELLDYLASELIRGGWKLKPIQKLIMTSSVYMEDSQVIAADEAIDSDNKLLWHRSPQRLEAEAIRDAMLVVGGSLDATMFGPGTLDEASARRSVYLTVKRSKAIPLMQVFDAPETMQSVGFRQTTTVATQALAMMNSPFVRAQAERLSKLARPSQSTDVKQAIDRAYVIAFARHADDSEQQRMADFIARQATGYGAVRNAQDLAMTDFCQILLSSSEFVYVD